MHLTGLIESHGPAGFYRKLCDLLNEKTLCVDDVSYRDLAEACGVLPSLRGLHALAPIQSVPAALSESNPGASTHLFQVVTGELIGRAVLEGYADDAGFIGDRLVSVLPSRRRNQRLAGFTALAGPTEIAEGHPYEDSTFGEKFVTTDEAKKGRILSVNEELIQFDQTGEINRRARQLGFYLRQERERTIVRAVADADEAGGKYVYRPNGVGTPLYPASGAARNHVGPGNTTSPAFATAVPLEDWTDIQQVLHYRATQVKDDRIDGTPRPIVVPARQLLVPEALAGTARGIAHATEVTAVTAAGRTTYANPLAGRLEVLSSPFLDEIGTAAASDWYLGDFRRQFVWTEIWPIQTFLQNADSPAAFERDVVLRVKVRYYGGVTATDTAFVTKVAGA